MSPINEVWIPGRSTASERVEIERLRLEWIASMSMTTQPLSFEAWLAMRKAPVLEVRS